MPQIDLSTLPDQAPAPEPDYGYGLRYNNGDPSTAKPKGLGYLGPLTRPDGGVMSEYSTGLQIGGKETEIPTIVPTLTKDEVNFILNMKDTDKLPESIVMKARAHAEERIKAGKDPFASTGEQQALYPELARAQIPAIKGAEEKPGLASRAWHAATDPLLPQIATSARAVADKIDEPTLDRSVPSAMLHGAVAGVTEGVGNVLTGLTSPANLVMTAAGIGGASKATEALPAVRAGLRAVEGLGGAAFAGEGAHQVATGDTLMDKALGVAEMAGGVAGVADAYHGRAASHPTPSPKGEKAIDLTTLPDRVAPKAAPAIDLSTLPDRQPGFDSQIASSGIGNYGHMRDAPEGSFPSELAPPPIPESAYANTYDTATGEVMPNRRVTPGSAPDGVERRSPNQIHVAEAAAETNGKTVGAGGGQQTLEALRTSVRQDPKPVAPYSGEPTFWGFEQDGTPKYTVQTESGPTQLPAEELIKHGMKVPETPDFLKPDVKPVPPPVKDVMVRTLGYTPEAVDKLGFDEAINRARKGVRGDDAMPQAGVDNRAAAASAAAQGQEFGVRRPNVNRIEEMAQVQGSPIPEQKNIQPADLPRMSTIEHQPEHVRSELTQIMEDNGGFESQRRGVQPIARTQEIAKFVEVNSKNALPKGTAMNAEEATAYAQTMARLSDHITSVTDKIAKGTATDAELADMMTKRQQLAVVTGNYMGVTAEAGRTLRNMREMTSIVASRDDQALKQALSMPGVRENLESFAKEWATKKTDIEKLDYMRSLQKRSTVDTLRGIYFGNILSGVKTSLRNIIGNTVNEVWHFATHPATVAADAVNSAVTGTPRTAFMGELAPRAYGTVRGLKQGIDDAIFTLKHGYGPSATATFDVPRPELPGGGKNPFNWSGRNLEAQDQFYHAIGYQQELNARLFAKAKAEGLQKRLAGKPLDDFMKTRLADWKLAPPVDVVRTAEAATQRMLFKETPGAIAQWVMKGKKDMPALDFIIAFVKTPANILRQGMVDNTPLTMTGRANRAAFAEGGRARAEIVGRAATGTAALSMLAYWAAQGRISGQGPKDPSARAALQEAGWKPYSVKIGDKWVDYANIFQPVAPLLFGIANAHDKYVETKKAPTAGDVASILTSIPSSALDQSFLSGVSDLNNALSDPDRYGKQFLEGKAQSLVPFSGLARNVAQAIDPVVRDSNTPGEAFRSIVPGLSKTVPPRLARSGEPVIRQGSAIERGLSPVTIGRPSDDPIVKELTKIGADSVGVPPKYLQKTERTPRIDLTTAERQQVGRAQWAAIQRLMNEAEWANTSDSDKRDAIDLAVQRARNAAARTIRISRGETR